MKKGVCGAYLLDNFDLFITVGNSGKRSNVIVTRRMEDWPLYLNASFRALLALSLLWFVSLLLLTSAEYLYRTAKYKKTSTYSCIL